MEATFSKEFKRIFLLTFTKELIKHSEKKDIIKLQKIIESSKKGKEKSSEETPIFTKETMQIEIPVQKTIEMTLQPVIQPLRLTKSALRKFTSPTPKQLFIPEPKLPSHLEYLKPIPTPGVEIDLFKINPLIKDPAVRLIEVNPDEKVMVSGTMGTKPTDIILTKDDIDRVINKFSEVSKIPTTEGIYRVVVGNLILSAIISETIGSRFTIKKMLVNPNQPQQNRLQQQPIFPFQNNR